MKNQDKLTQVYQDAFKDFAVEAPASIQSAALAEVGRKSLLTIDPTRLNVFYLALMSGVVAWALMGVPATNIAEQESPSKPKQVTSQMIEQDEVQYEKLSSQLVAEQTNHESHEVSETSFVFNSENVEKTAPSLPVSSEVDSDYASSDVIQTNTSKSLITEEDHLEKQEVLSADEVSEVTMSNDGLEIEGEGATCKENEIDESKNEIEQSIAEDTSDDAVQTQVDGMKPQSAQDLLWSMSLDSDGRIPFKIKSKKSK